MVNVYLEAKVPRLGNILHCKAPFDKALDAIESKGGKIITGEQFAVARMAFGRDHSLSENDSYFRPGDLFVPKAEHKRYLLKKSIILSSKKRLKEAVDAHREGYEYFLGKNFDINAYLNRIGEKNFFVFDDLSPVPTDCFGDSKAMVFLFGNHAQKYGLWLRNVQDGNVSGISVAEFVGFRTEKYIDGQSEPFADQLWLDRLGNNSNIIGDSRSLYYSYTVRGVCRIAVGDAPKVVETYTPKEMKSLVTKSLNSAGIIGKSQKLVISDLEKRLK